MKRRRQLSCILLAVLLLASLPVQAGTKPFAEGSIREKGCIVAASAVASVPYFASKLVFCLGGGLAAGGVNLFSAGFAQETATDIGTAAINGDWIVYPGVLTGERPLEFVGRDGPVEMPVLTMNER